MQVTKEHIEKAYYRCDEGKAWMHAHFTKKMTLEEFGEFMREK